MITKNCPYWDIIEELPYQDNGYCHWLERGDNNCPGLSLLWDCCKECSLKMYKEEDDR